MELKYSGLLFVCIKSRTELIQCKSKPDSRQTVETQENWFTFANHITQKSEIFTYSWKVQAEPEDVISGYAAQEKAGLGPFRFYRASDLQKAFASISVKESGKNAFEIEKSLESLKLTAAEAYKAFLQGEVIGHTVAVLKSSKK